MAVNVYDYRSGEVRMEILGPRTTIVPPESAEWDEAFDVGNVVAYSEEPKVTIKKHQGGDGTGKKAIDRMIPVGAECTLKITLDEFSKENLRRFYLGVLEGTTIGPMEGGVEEYAVRVTEYLQSGTARVREWYRVVLSAAAALELVTLGDGETDWSKMEFSGEVMLASTGKWGTIYVAPTA